MKTRDSMPVRGNIQPANEAGFGKILIEANKAYDDGLLLIGVVPVGSDKIGAVFVRMPHGDRPNLIGD